MARTYKRDRLGRFARTNSKRPSKKYGRAGAAAGALLLVGGPVYMPLGAGVGFTAGRAIDNAVNKRR